MSLYLALKWVHHLWCKISDRLCKSWSKRSWWPVIITNNKMKCRKTGYLALKEGKNFVTFWQDNWRKQGKKDYRSVRNSLTTFFLFFLSVFSFTNFYDSKNSWGMRSPSQFFSFLSATSTGFIDILTLPRWLLQRTHLCT